MAGTAYGVFRDIVIATERLSQPHMINIDVGTDLLTHLEVRPEEGGLRLDPVLFYDSAEDLWRPTARVGGGPAADGSVRVLSNGIPPRIFHESAQLVAPPRPGDMAVQAAELQDLAATCTAFVDRVGENLRAGIQPPFQTEDGILITLATRIIELSQSFNRSLGYGIGGGPKAPESALERAIPLRAWFPPRGDALGL